MPTPRRGSKAFDHEGVLLGLALAVSGCTGDPEIIDDAERISWTVLPEYLEYVKNDPTLTEDEKAIRVMSCEDFVDSLERIDGMRPLGRPTLFWGR